MFERVKLIMAITFEKVAKLNDLFLNYHIKRFKLKNLLRIINHFSSDFHTAKKFLMFLTRENDSLPNKNTFDIQL